MMKSITKKLGQFAGGVCISFTVSLCLYVLICALIGWTDAILFSTMLQFLAISVLACLYQWVAFTPLVFKHLRYAWRQLIFVALFLPTLVAFAYFAQWFPSGQWSSWAVFLGIFLVIFVVCSLGFELYFRIQGRRYDQLLGQRQQQDKQP